MNSNRGSSGKIIKVIAIIFLVIGLIISITVGVQVGYLWDVGGFLGSVVLALVVFLIFLMLYGFGELVANTAETNDHLEEQRRQMEKLAWTISKLSDNAVPANPGKAKTESRLASGAATQKSTADNAASPTVKTHISTDKEFIESLLEMDSASEMLKRIQEKYPDAENSNLQPLIENLQKDAKFEKIYGKATADVRKTIQNFLDANGNIVVDTIICPNCGREQNVNRKVCLHCGASFQD